MFKFKFKFKQKVFLFTFFIVFLPAAVAANSLPSESLAPLTRQELKIDPESSSLFPTRPTGYFTAIHPSHTIAYEESDSRLENQLKEFYDLILMVIGPIQQNTNISLYGIKKNITVYVDGHEVEPIDFYDYELKLSGHAVYSASLGRYVGSGRLKVAGYLLLPKIIKPDTQEIKLNYGNQWIKWDWDKINKMIEILK